MTDLPRTYFGLVDRATGVVEYASAYESTLDGYDLAVLPDGVWLGFVRQADGSFALPVAPDIVEEIHAEVPA